MKKLFVITIVFALALALCACKKPVSEVTAPTAEPTEEVTPEPTEEPTPEPTEEPTPEPTEEPTPEPTATPVPTPMPTEVPVPAKPVPEGDYFAEVRAELPVIVDIDGDGEDDIVLISENLEDGRWVNGYRVTIDRACDPGNPFVWDTDDQSWAILGAIVDCDPETPAKQLVFWARMEDAGGATYAVRLKDDGSDFEVFVHPAEFFGGSAFMTAIPTIGCSMQRRVCPSSSARRFSARISFRTATRSPQTASRCLTMNTSTVMNSRSRSSASSR